MSLKLNNLQILYPDKRPVFEPLTFTVQAANIASLMGPSGCGKSTLLSALSGHLESSFSLSGEVMLNGRDILCLPAHQRRIGLLFQDDLLFPHLNIWQNIALALPESIKGKAARQAKAMEYLAAIELVHLANHMPDQISGGQRARVSLGRLLASEPQAVLLDEPFSKLDESLRDNFRTWVFEQIKARHIPCIMVTHDMTDVPDPKLCIAWPWQQHITQLNVID